MMATHSVMDQHARLAMRKHRDRSRTAMQAPIAVPMYCVLYLKNGKEHRSPWLYKEEHAQAALEMMQGKYGKKNAIIYMD